MDARRLREAACPVCRCPRPVEFLGRSRVPVHQNLLLASPRAARDLARGELTMLACPQCGFAHNASFDESLLNYGSEYDNTQTHSSAFARYVAGLVTSLVEERGVRGRRIVEVGCGKGAFLTRLVEHAAADNLGFGFDPTYLGPDVALDGRLRFQRSYYDPARGPAADVMICRHVIEHVADPLSLLRSMHAGLRNSADGRVFVETPCLEWILRREVVWDFFYEHCSLFTAASLAEALRRAGFVDVRVGHVFDGQYLWAEGRAASITAPAPAHPAAEPPTGAELVALARRFHDREQEQLRAWRRRLRMLRECAPVAVWGAGAKGVTFCNLIDPACEAIACVVDVNPAKQGNFIAGTGHPIIGPRHLEAAQVATALVLNPNYKGEIERLLARDHLSVAMIDLLEPGKDV